MSFWITHLRIGETLFKAGVCPEECETAFYIGNIAPDSGELVDGKFRYEPPKSVTHWIDALPDRLENNALFREKYIDNETDPTARAFYLGYYAHILTDTFFVTEHIDPIIRRAPQEWREKGRYIAGDWFNDDYLFIASHPDFRPYKLLDGVTEFENKYIDCFGKDQIYVHIKRAVNEFKINKADEREYKYVPLEVSEKFVEETPSRILEIFGKEGII